MTVARESEPIRDPDAAFLLIDAVAEWSIVGHKAIIGHISFDIYHLVIARTPGGRDLHPTSAR